jgi:hypothetical protein
VSYTPKFLTLEKELLVLNELEAGWETEQLLGGFGEARQLLNLRGF